MSELFGTTLFADFRGVAASPRCPHGRRSHRHLLRDLPWEGVVRCVACGASAPLCYDYALTCGDCRYRSAYGWVSAARTIPVPYKRFWPHQ